MALIVGENIDKILRLKGKRLDTVSDDLAVLKRELFPDTADGLISFYESVYQIVPAESATLEERRNTIIAKRRARGRCNDNFFRKIATGLGYAIGTHAEVGDPHLRMTEGDYPSARAGFAKAGISKVWDQVTGQSRYTWCVRGTNVESDLNLQSIFNKHKLKSTDIKFINE